MTWFMRCCSGFRNKRYWDIYLLWDFWHQCLSSLSLELVLIGECISQQKPVLDSRLSVIAWVLSVEKIVLFSWWLSPLQFKHFNFEYYESNLANWTLINISNRFVEYQTILRGITDEIFCSKNIILIIKPFVVLRDMYNWLESWLQLGLAGRRAVQI